MRCKNDPGAAYKGDEPSPKGLGWCAHGEALGARRRGRDGRPWVVTATAAGVRRWAPERDDEGRVDALRRELERGISAAWWERVARGHAALAFLKDGSYALVASRLKTDKARVADTGRALERYAADPAVKAVAWIPMSRDGLTFFVRHILAKASPRVVADVLAHRGGLSGVAPHFAALFERDEGAPLVGGKGFRMRGVSDELDAGKVARRLRRV